MTSSSVLLAFFLPLTLHPYEAVEAHMGTLIRIKLYAADQATAQRAFHAAFDRVKQLDDTLSDYQPDSELDRITDVAVGHPVHVSDDLYRVLAASQQLSRESGGAFDVTIGPLTHLWRTARKRNRLPEAPEIAAAKAKCGFQKLHLDDAQHTVEFDQGGMQLDVGAIAKGYAADEALAVLTHLGIRSALVAASGDLAFSDAPPGEPDWKIGVDSLDEANAPFTRILHLANQAVSTSGATEQYLDAGSTRYSHIVNPSTGMGLTRSLTVTVISPRGIDADSLATAISVMGEEQGLRLIKNKPGTSAIIVPETAR